MVMLVAAIAIVSAISGCSPPGVKGDGVIMTTNRPIGDFSALVVNGAYKIKWTSGKPALTISTDQNLLPLIETTVSGNTLEIDQEKQLRPSKGITINLSSASLSEVRVNGAVNFTGSSLAGHDLKLECNGASSINVDGAITNFEVNLSGASKLNAESLRTQTAKVSLNGAAYADIAVSDSLDASISGAGLLTYSGNPKSVEKNISGAGRIRAR
jgi:putative autotransporter adhesin-like protein